MDFIAEEVEFDDDKIICAPATFMFGLDPYDIEHHAGRKHRRGLRYSRPHRRRRR